jgi:hypothetical protein
MPQDTRVLRRERRKAWRGTPTGRRATHEVKTTYGAGQRRRDREARWAELRAQAASSEEAA